MQSKTMTRKQAGLDLDQQRSATYLVNEVFYSVQGEGVLAGTPMVFVRLAKCNLRCSVANAGFDCDTEFESGRALTGERLLEEIRTAAGDASPEWVLVTGGEPGLQLDEALIEVLHLADYRIAVETNGTVKLPAHLDWVCVSPKSAWHTLNQRIVHELKMVRRHGQALPEIDALPKAVAIDNYVVSPAFKADGSLDKEAAAWCVELVKANPRWRLSLQTHKLLGVR